MTGSEYQRIRELKKHINRVQFEQEVEEKVDFMLASIESEDYETALSWAEWAREELNMTIRALRKIKALNEGSK